jgi:hypothetical protein
MKTQLNGARLLGVDLASTNHPRWAELDGADLRGVGLEAAKLEVVISESASPEEIDAIRRTLNNVHAKLLDLVLEGSH